MAAFWLALGALAIPLAMIIVIETKIISVWIYILIAIGGISLITGLVLAWHNELQNGRDRQYLREKLGQIHRDIITELKGIRQDMGDENERNNSVK